MCFKCRMYQLSGKPPKIQGLEPELLRVAKLIHSGKMKPGDIDKAMVRKIADQLMKGVFKGYGKNLTSKTLTEAERTFLTQVKKNVYVFGGFKNYQQLKEASLLLATDDGKLKPFNQWFTEFKQISKTYNEVYQNAEYGNAVSSSQNAASWHDFINNGIETLTFQTAEDDRVRPEHAMLDGMTVDIDDPILNVYFTPLDWGCRCEWIPGQAKNITDVNDYILPDLPKMFQNNVGKTGIVFPETHPYFDTSKKVAKSINQQVDDILNEEED